MSHSIRFFNSLAGNAFDAAVTVLWQSTLLILLVALVLHFCRALPPSIRCWAWRLVAIKLLLMPFWAVQIPVLTPAVTQLTPPQTPAKNSASTNPSSNDDHSLSTESRAPDAPQSIAHKPSPSQIIDPTVAFTWQTTLTAVCLCIVAVQLARLLWQHVQLGRMLHTTKSPPPLIADIVAQCSHELGLRRRPEPRVAAQEISPFVCRIFRPLLVLPASLVADAKAPQLRPIVLHELAHIRRRDLAWRLVLEITRILWWFHPLAHWVAYRESLERELACDQLAMRHAHFSAAEYARTLIDAASRMAFPAVLRAAAAARFDGGRPLDVAPTTTSTNPTLRSLGS